MVWYGLITSLKENHGSPLRFRERRAKGNRLTFIYICKDLCPCTMRGDTGNLSRPEGCSITALVQEGCDQSCSGTEGIASNIQSFLLRPINGIKEVVSHAVGMKKNGGAEDP